tara:strand:+ start:11700 stop:14237 length:2538 start_codon:yes stop_codon:yes gene_type:complete
MFLAFKKWSIYLFMLIFISACGSSNDEDTQEVVSITQLELSIPELILDYEQSTQIKVTAIFSDNSEESLESGLTFTSSNSEVVSVSESGLISAISEGQAMINVSYDGIKSSQTINVSYAIIDSELRLTPTSDTFIEGTNYQASLWHKKSDNKYYNVKGEINWTSSNDNLAKISNTGFLELLKPGEVSVTADFEGLEAQKFLAIEAKEASAVSVDLEMSTVPLGQQTALVVSALFNNGTTEHVTDEAIISVANSDIVTVNDQGLVSTLNIGTTSIHVVYKGFEENVSIEVTDAVLEGLQLNLVSNNTPAGLKTNYTVKKVFSDNSITDVTNEKRFKLSSDNTYVASIDNYIINAHQMGEANITATLDGFESTAKLTVTDAVINSIKVEVLEQVIPLGLTTKASTFAQLSNDSTVNIAPTYSTSDEQVLTVSSDGIITSKGVGKALVSASFDGFEDSIEVTVTAAALNAIEISFNSDRLPIGRKTKANAVGIYTDSTRSDVTNDVTWVSGVSNLVVVSNVIKGELTALVNDNISIGDGGIDVAITASLNGIKSTSHITVTKAVLDSIAINSSSESVALGQQINVTASATYSDSSIVDVSTEGTWLSSDENIATVSSEGVVTPIAEGYTQINFNFNGMSDSVAITVGPAVVETITVSSQVAELYKGRKTLLQAIAAMSDGTSKNLTSFGTWTVNDSSVATVSNDLGLEGELTALTGGTVSITFTPMDKNYPAAAYDMRVKDISEMASKFGRSVSSSLSVINGVVQRGSQITLSVANRTGVKLLAINFDVADKDSVKVSQALNDVVENNSSFGYRYTVGLGGAVLPITLTYTFEDEVTSEAFNVSYIVD